jgi:hypothetical protein
MRLIVAYPVYVLTDLLGKRSPAVHGTNAAMEQQRWYSGTGPFVAASSDFRFAHLSILPFVIVPCRNP